MNLAFGKNLKKLRREKDMTQDELAQALTLSVQAISRYETGAAYPDIEMLPVIAGYFGVTVDSLLGISGDARQRRMDEYTEQIRRLTDRGDRLALLRRQHAEFPEAWNVVSDMVYEMTFLPECVEEMRTIASDAARRCDEPLWRENIFLHYLQAEPEEETALAFLNKWSSKYDMRKSALLEHRYSCRREWDKQGVLKQKKLRDDLTASLFALSERGGGSAEDALRGCEQVLGILDALSGRPDRTEPDMWFSARRMILFRSACNLFLLDRVEEGFLQLETAVRLMENFFALPDGTLLDYGTPKLDRLRARTQREVFWQITQFTGMTAHSMMMDLVYETPLGPVWEDEPHIHDMEGFQREMVFASHAYDILKKAQWDGFARMRKDPRYGALLERVKAVTTLENTDNLLFLLRQAAERTDEWVQGKEWACALLTHDAGAYVIWDEPGDLEEKIDRMKREGNSAVCRIAAVRIGGWLTPPPEAVVRAVTALDPANADAQVLLADACGNTVSRKLSDCGQNNG